MSTHTKVTNIVIDYNWGSKKLGITEYKGAPSATIHLTQEQTQIVENFIMTIYDYKNGHSNLSKTMSIDKE